MDNTINKIAIMCIDARMNRVADNMNDGNTVFVRTAAANPQGVSSTISEIISKHKIDKIVYVPHNDCGACKFTHSLLLNGEGTTDEIERGLISTIRSYSHDRYNEVCRSSTDLERKFQELGSEFIQKQHPFISFETRMENTSTPVTGEKTLVLIRPSPIRYSALCEQLKIPEDSTYISQHYNFTEAICDVQLASSALHIKKIIVAVLDDSEKTKIKDEVQILKRAVKNVPDIKFSITSINTIKETSNVKERMRIN